MNNDAVLLINPPFREKVIRSYYCCFTSKADYLWPPIDLLVQSGILATQYSVEVIDAVAESLSDTQTLERVAKKKYKAILSLTGSFTWKRDFEFLNLLVKQTSSQLFISGNIALFETEFLLKRYPLLTGVLHNFTSYDLLRFLNGETYFQSLSFRKENTNEMTIGKRNYDPHLPISYPVPKHQLFPLKYYSTPLVKNLPMTVLITAFGCPFCCTFCVSSTLDWRKRPIEDIIEELKAVQSLGIKELFIEDNTFTASKRYVQILCQRIIEEKMHLSWTCNIHASTIDRPTLIAMKRAGCHLVQVGVESASDSILEKHKKSTNTDQIKNCLRLCQEVGLRTLGYFIIGLPGETISSTHHTIQYAIDLNPTYASFSIATPDYGTSMRQEVIEKKYMDNSMEEFDSSTTPLITTDTLTASQIKTLERFAYKRFYLRPKKILELLGLHLGYRRLKLLLENAIFLFKKYGTPDYRN